MFKLSSGMTRILTVVSLFVVSIIVVQCSSQTTEKNKPKKQAEGHKRAMEDIPELADAMGALQRYTHKYALALDAKNHELATFYFHEVRASADGIKKNIPGYEGYDISRFMKLMLDPTLQPIEEALANRNWEKAREKTIDMINGCNSCHNATSHGFIQVTPGFDNNPYNQDFSAPE